MEHTSRTRPDRDMSSSSSSGSSSQQGSSSKPRGFIRRKVCRFCMDKNDRLDFKDINRLKRYVTERGKIIPRRITGNCARHQRLLTEAVKRARNIALLPFSSE